MKRLVVKKNVCLILALLLVVALALSLTLFGGTIARADEQDPESPIFKGQETVSTSQLYNSTNTFNYIGNNNNVKGSDEYRKYRYYNVDGSRNDNEVSQDTQITVITHGLGSNASDWSNIEGRFARDEDSLISVLKRETDAQVYWAAMAEHDSFRLVDLNDSKNIVNEDYINA